MQAQENATFRNTVILIVGLFVVWELAYLVVGDVALRSPWQTTQFLGKLMQTDLFWLHLADSLKAFAVALVIAVVLGLLIGFALGLHRLSGEAMEPMLVALYSIPKITLYPIILLAFGIGISAKIAFGAIHGIIPVALFTLNAVRTTRPILIKTGRVMKLSPVVMVREILFPAAVPEIFTGIRVGFSLTLIGTVLGEMFAAQRGLGYLLMSAISLYNVDLIMAVTFLLVVLAAAVNTVLLVIDRRLHTARLSIFLFELVPFPQIERVGEALQRHLLLAIREGALFAGSESTQAMQALLHCLGHASDEDVRISDLGKSHVEKLGRRQPRRRRRLENRGAVPGTFERIADPEIVLRRLQAGHENPVDPETRNRSARLIAASRPSAP